MGDNRDKSKDSRFDNIVGYVPYENDLDPWLSLRENILFNAELYKVSTDIASKRIEKFSRLLDFRNQLDRTAHKVSGGIHKKTMIVRGLVQNPDILILDEPTAGINPTLINGIIDRLIKVNNDFGITLLVIEHNMRVIMQLAQQIFCLAHGQLIANGTPDEIKNDQRVIDAYLGVQ